MPGKYLQKMRLSGQRIEHHIIARPTTPLQRFISGHTPFLQPTGRVVDPVGWTARGCLVLWQASASRSRYTRHSTDSSASRRARHRTSGARTSSDCRVAPCCGRAECQRPGATPAAGWDIVQRVRLLSLEENLAQWASRVGALDAEPRHELGRLLESPSFGILGTFREGECSRPADRYQHRYGGRSAEQKAPAGLQPLGLRGISSRCAGRIGLPPAGNALWLFISHREATFGGSSIVPHHIGLPKAKQPRLGRPDRAATTGADQAGRAIFGRPGKITDD